MRLDVRGFFLARGSSESCAPKHLESVLQQHFDQIKLVVIEHRHERIFALAVIFSGQHLVHVFGQFQALRGVRIREPERFGDGALQPVRVDVRRIQPVVRVRRVLILDCSRAHGAVVRAFVAFVVVVYVGRL